MANESHLRALSDNEGPARPAQSSRPRRDRATWIPLALGVALALTLALLVWSRLELGQRIALLQDEVRTLETAVAERERVIAAHGQRLGTVKLRVDELQTLLDEPLPAVE